MLTSPIKLDPNWNNGNYYGKAEPVDGLRIAMKLLTLQSQNWAWADSSAFGRKWAAEGKDPADCLVECRFAIEAVLDATGRGGANYADANHFLYLAKANQLFVAGGKTLAEGLKRITAPTLIIATDDDLFTHPDAIKQTAELLKAGGVQAEVIRIKGGRGHLDGIHAIGQVGPQISAFLSRASQ
jgi:homoserine O-acetyltransferase